MASVSLRSKSNLLSTISKRYVSSSAASAAAAAAASQQHSQKRSAALPRESLRITKLDNGIVVASIENNSPVSRVAAIFNVGSRDESYEERGASHALRVYSSLATKNYSVFGVSRNLDQAGADLSVTSTREQTTYFLQSTRNNLQRSIDVLGDVVSKPELRHWEISDATPRLEFDLDVYDEQPEVRIVDLTHRAAFRNALSNPLFAKRGNVANLDSDLLQQFRNRHFTSNRLTLVGVGIRHDDLIKQSNLFRLANTPNVARQQARYLGVEEREENESEIVHATLSGEGVSLSSKHYLASAIANHAFGAQGQRIKYSNGSSRISKTVVPLAKEPLSVCSFNFNYTDTGLFGFHIIGNKSDVGNVVQGVYKDLVKTSKSGLSSEEIARAKNSLKASLSYSLERTQNLIDEIGRNSGNANAYTNPQELFQAIDAVPANDVNAFVQKVASSRPSLAAIGDLSEFPRIDELSA